MYNAIVELMQEHNVDEIDFNDYKDYDKGYAINATYDFACEEEIAKISLDNGCLEVVTITEYGEKSPWLDLNNDFLLASFNTLYDTLYYILEGKS